MRAVERAVARVRGRVAAAVRDAVPDAVVREEAAGVVVEARGLTRRVLRDARLRWIAGWLR